MNMKDNKFERSLDAYESIGYFFGKKYKYTCFVEGPDDRIFWEKCLEKFGINDFWFEELGGKKEIEKKINSLTKEQKVFFCIDRDFNEFLNNLKMDNRIIYTYGHSIENSICCGTLVFNRIVYEIKKERKLTKENLDKKIAEASRLFLEFLNNSEKELKEIVIFDILDEKKKLEIDSGYSYISYSFCPKNFDKTFKIKDNKLIWKDSKTKENFLKEGNKRFLEKEINEINGKLAEVKFLKYVRGHFLFKLIGAFLHSKKIKTKNEDFERELIEKFSFCKNDCLQYNYYESQALKFKKLI